jgi:porin
VIGNSAAERLLLAFARITKSEEALRKLPIGMASLGVALGLAGRATWAQPAPQPNLGLSDWLEWNDMTGDWGGLRDQLHDDGIITRGHYVNEAAGNPVGGREQGGADTGEVMLGADLDSRVIGRQDGTFHLTITERAGSSLSKDKTGNILTVQEIYGDGQTVRLTELSYEQKFFGGRIDVEAGHINVENDFASSPVYFGGALWCNFQNNAICGTPIAAPNNTNGYVAYPASNWGARIKATPLRNTYIEAGAYAVDPTLNDARNGFKLGLNDSRGVFTVVETGVTVGTGGYLGNYRIGAYYDNSDNPSVQSQLTRYATPQTATQILAMPVAERAGRYGGWALADQTVELDPGNPKRGIVVFAALEYGDRETSLLNWYGEAGVVREGTFDGRDSDTIALGFAAASINGSLEPTEQRIGAPTSVEEYMMEVNYGVSLGPWLTVRPGLQYIWHPSGIDEIPNALVLELKTVINF